MLARVQKIRIDPSKAATPRRHGMHEFWANVIVAVHLGYLAYVIGGMLAILLGMVFRWQWIRNPWFRLTHMAMILVVAFEAYSNITCPLTTWEQDLRNASMDPLWPPLNAAKAVALADAPLIPGPLVAAAALQKDWARAESQTFVGQCLRWIMFPDVPEEYLTMVYYVFAAAVVASFIVAPPRFRKKQIFVGPLGTTSTQLGQR